MKNPLPKITDEVGEFIKDSGKAAVREVKDFGKVAKTQISGQPGSGDSGSQVQEKRSDSASDKKDPVTGKPVPTKRQLTDLKTQTAQLQLAKLKKVRDDLAQQRLKVSGQQQTTQDGTGPEVKQEDKKPKDDAVKNTLKGSKSTGEFKGLVGG